MRPCPFCKCINCHMCFDSMDYYIICPSCGATGPKAKWQSDAVAMWDGEMEPPNVLAPMEYME